MARPIDNLPVWGESAALISEPSAGKKDIGWLVERPPVEYMNWLQREYGRWINYLDGDNTTNKANIIKNTNNAINNHAINPYLNIDQLGKLDDTTPIVRYSGSGEYLIDMWAQLGGGNPANYYISDDMPTGFEGYGKSLKVVTPTPGGFTSTVGFSYTIYNNGIWGIDNPQMIMAASQVTFSLFVKTSIGNDAVFSLYRDSTELIFEATQVNTSFEQTSLTYDIASDISSHPTSKYDIRIDKLVSNGGEIMNITMLDIYPGAKKEVWQEPRTNELQLCQRYYWQISGSATGGTVAFNGDCISSASECTSVIYHPEEMIKSPTIVTTGTLTDYTISSKAITYVSTSLPTLFFSNKLNSGIKFTSTGFGVLGEGSQARLITGANKFIGFDANIF